MPSGDSKPVVRGKQQKQAMYSWVELQNETTRNWRVVGKVDHAKGLDCETCIGRENKIAKWEATMKRIIILVIWRMGKMTTEKTVRL